MEEKIVKVGVGVLIYNNKNEILLGLRKSKHGEGTWCPPGGHLEYGESFEEAGVRETAEETGLILNKQDLAICGVTNDFFKESGKHYVTAILKTVYFLGEPVVKEPDKCAEWRWFPKDKLPDNLFLPICNFLNKYKL